MPCHRQSSHPRNGPNSPFCVLKRMRGPRRGGEKGGGGTHNPSCGKKKEPEKKNSFFPGEKKGKSVLFINIWCDSQNGNRPQREKETARFPGNKGGPLGRERPALYQTGGWNARWQPEGGKNLYRRWGSFAVPKGGVWGGEGGRKKGPYQPPQKKTGKKRNPRPLE